MYELIKKKESVEVISSEAETHKIGKYIVESALGIVGVVVSAYFIVESASFLALSIGIPPIVVGATVVAFGTSVPELATSIDAVRKGFIDLALGNVIGSCFINITLILGLTFLISPFNVNVSAFSDLVIFSLISNIVLWYILQNTKISKREGLILLAIYALFIAISFGRGSS
jgi:cation:H+ antiporter